MSAFKKSLLVAGVAMILSNNVFADEVTVLLNLKVKLSLLHVLLNQVTKI